MTEPQVSYPNPQILPPLPLPPGITSRYLDCSPSSLIFHILESGKPSPGQTKPLILLVHGFPELAYSWRHILPSLAQQDSGYHVVAMDQRGYGRTHHHKHPDPIPADTFRPTSLIKDILHIVAVLGYTSVSCIAGHDFGAVTAALCALSRPDIFHSLVLLSHPFKGAPVLNYSTPKPQAVDMEAELRKLARPRKHYKWYYCTSPANNEMTHPTGQPLHSFLRGYFHLKSADWSGNAPHALQGWTASELEKMPRYYIMDSDAGMRENVQRDMSRENASEVQQKSSRWLSDTELQVYASEYGRNTFQGGLNWYAIQTQPAFLSDYEIWAGRKIEVPTCFVAGAKDWGTFQEPGAVEALESGRAVPKDLYRGTHLIPGAGHWVTQEQAGECVGIIARMAREGSAGMALGDVVETAKRLSGVDEPAGGKGSKI
jgi:pimeloyl-ACP methyl ester carboxylesterase